MIKSPVSFRILSLAGGGYLGLFTAELLAQLEDWAGEPLARRFDLIAGTSVGGILALALAYEIPMRTVAKLFAEHGPEIFSDRSKPSGQVGRLLDLTRSVFGPKYNGDALRHALLAHFAELNLAEAKHAVVIPAVDVSRSHTKIFKTPHAKASTGDEDVLAIDVAMATSAAPAYFPAVDINGRLYADGGLFAVAPDQVALHEAEHFLGIDPAEVAMLSLGTATAGYQPEDAIEADDGAIGWLSDGRLIMTLVAVQQQHVEAMLQQRLSERYLRLDAEWPTGEGLGIDVATSKVAGTLQGLAKQTLKAAEVDRLRRLFHLIKPGAERRGKPRGVSAKLKSKPA